MVVNGQTTNIISFTREVLITYSMNFPYGKLFVFSPLNKPEERKIIEKAFCFLYSNIIITFSLPYGKNEKELTWIMRDRDSYRCGLRHFF